MRERTSWDVMWMQMAHAVASRSRCTRDQVGAVVVSNTNRILSTGYNGPPASMFVEGMCTNFCLRAQAEEHELEPGYTDCPSIHAEANALLFTDREVREGGTVYVSSTVCFTCAKLIANSGLTRVVMSTVRTDAHRNPHRTIDFLRDCRITVHTSGDLT